MRPGDAPERLDEHPPGDRFAEDGQLPPSELGDQPRVVGVRVDGLRRMSSDSSSRLLALTQLPTQARASADRSSAATTTESRKVATACPGL